MKKEKKEKKKREQKKNKNKVNKITNFLAWWTFDILKELTDPLSHYTLHTLFLSTFSLNYQCYQLPSRLILMTSIYCYHRQLNKYLIFSIIRYCFVSLVTIIAITIGMAICPKLTCNIVTLMYNVPKYWHNGVKSSNARILPTVGSQNGGLLPMAE